MLSADGRLIVSGAAAVQAATAAAKGRRNPVQVEEQRSGGAEEQRSPPFGRSITDKTRALLHTAGKWRTRAAVPPLRALPRHWLGARGGASLLMDCLECAVQ